MSAPLFVKYRTSSGIPYVYDLGTGEIVRVGETVYEILNDFRILSDSELVRLYSDLGSAAVREALAALYKVRERGILRDHDPVVPERADVIIRKGGASSLTDYLREARNCLILCLTEQCNLRCDYCCFGECYPRFRSHSPRQMSREVAERAILELLSQPGIESPGVALYGGEPLLNWELAKRVIVFSLEQAEARGKTATLSVTTNGTLLTDEKIRFLAGNDVNVAISLDGPKDSHDRHRVFRDRTGSGRRVGSFDVVMRKLRRFIELYPDYRNRGIFMTLSPPYNMEECEALLSELWPYFPASRVGFVSEEYNSTWDANGPRLRQSGCAPPASCSGGDATICGTADAASEETGQRRYIENRYIRGRVQLGAEIRSAFPFANMVYREMMSAFHGRPITTDNVYPVFNYKCYPGAIRLYCDVDGRYYVCQRCESTEKTLLGEVWTGFDPRRSELLLEELRHIADCGNCIAQRHCSNCFVSFQQKPGAGGVIGEGYDFRCRSIRRSTPETLRMYTEILEQNPNAFDEAERDDDLDGMRVLPGKFQPPGPPTELGVEELAW
ncbi:MAG: radical SAM protein [Isosphaeraceae bacterium]